MDSTTNEQPPVEEPEATTIREQPISHSDNIQHVFDFRRISKFEGYYCPCCRVAVKPYKKGSNETPEYTQDKHGTKYHNTCQRALKLFCDHPSHKKKHPKGGWFNTSKRCHPSDPCASLEERINYLERNAEISRIQQAQLINFINQQRQDFIIFAQTLFSFQNVIPSQYQPPPFQNPYSSLSTPTGHTATTTNNVISGASSRLPQPQQQQQAFDSTSPPFINYVRMDEDNFNQIFTSVITEKELSKDHYMKDSTTDQTETRRKKNGDASEVISRDKLDDDSCLPISGPDIETSPILETVDIIQESDIDVNELTDMMSTSTISYHHGDRNSVLENHQVIINSLQKLVHPEAEKDVASALRDIREVAGDYLADLVSPVPHIHEKHGDATVTFVNGYLFTGGQFFERETGLETSHAGFIDYMIKNYTKRDIAAFTIGFILKLFFDITLLETKSAPPPLALLSRDHLLLTLLKEVSLPRLYEIAHKYDIPIMITHSMVQVMGNSYYYLCNRETSLETEIQEICNTLLKSCAPHCFKYAFFNDNGRGNISMPDLKTSYLEIIKILPILEEYEPSDSKEAPLSDKKGKTRPRSETSSVKRQQIKFVRTD